MAEHGDDRRAFLVDLYKSHVDHIRTGQARRFEILRFTFIGFFGYWAFVFGVETAPLLCRFTFETVVLIPCFLLLQVFLYIQIVNHNIAKHGRYIDYLFEQGLAPLGLGENLYGRFIAERYLPDSPVERAFRRHNLHFSQVVLAVLAGACLLLYGYVERAGGFGLLVACPDGT